jgi:hypothetical protein
MLEASRDLAVLVVNVETLAIATGCRVRIEAGFDMPFDPEFEWQARERSLLY